MAAPPSISCKLPKPVPRRQALSPSTSVCSLPYLTCLTRLSNVYLCSPYRPHDAHNPHSSHNPDTPHDRCTRPLAGSATAAAAASCAPPRCVVAPRPELEKTWLIGRRSRPLSAPASPQTSHQPLLSLAITPSDLLNSDAKGLSRLTPSSTATSHALAVLHRRPNRLQHAIAVGYIQATGQKA